MRKLIWLLIINLFSLTVFAQNATVKGLIKEESTGEPLIGVNIKFSDEIGTTTDFDGKYKLEVPAGTVVLTYTYIGYEEKQVTIRLQPGQKFERNMSMSEVTKQIGTVVVSTSKYARKIQEESVSMDVIKPKLIESTNASDVTEVLTKVPGMTVIDGQASIRGGSGYSYGAGTRVMMVIDDMPLLTTHESAVKWDFVPIETVEQIEIIKGASTVQYGSSALNGVVHVRTKWPKKEPETKVVTYYKFMNNPPEKNYKWWNRDSSFLAAPHGIGTYFSHTQKFGDFDLVVGGLMHSSQSHLNEDFDRRSRLNFKFRHRPSKLKQLNYGVNANMMYRKNSFFLFWEDVKDAPYLARNRVETQAAFFHVDPYITYFDKKNIRHKLQGRYYWFRNIGSNSKPTGHFVTADYQAQKDFSDLLSITAGATNTHVILGDSSLGQHKADNGGVYVQGDFNWQNLTVSGGARYEFFRLDDLIATSRPVFRLGANYKFNKKNYVRASFGQGFRVPGLAERFFEDDFDDIYIYRNPDVKPEKGYTLELGYKRDFSIGEWAAYFDAVTFWTEFDDLVEFTFGQWGPSTPPTFGLGFKTVNVSKARIAGYEFEFVGDGKLGKIPVTALIGYTYTFAIDLNEDPSLKNIGRFYKKAFQSMVDPDEDALDAMLRYRFRHLIKADIEGTYKKITIGTSLKYYSYMDKMDPVFELFFGLEEIRELEKHGEIVFDIRTGYEITDFLKVNFVINNILNRDYSIRPAKPEAPRNYTIQTSLTF